MKTFAIILKSLVLSLLLAWSALAADKVNINTADAAAIDAALVNIGPAKAQAIVEWRKQHGAFKSIEQLGEIKGIGQRTLERNRAFIRLGDGPATAAPAAAKR